MISLSEITPNARITINKGIGILTFGIFTTILPFFLVGVGATILTANVRVGFDVSSETERISAEYVYISLPLSVT